ncbi:MAG TPA: ATP-binding protein [Clostridia bacterium]|nr:ATP-binding protein [Clostridia bacterium]
MPGQESGNGFSEIFDIAAGAFSTAGEASASVKRLLKTLGVDSAVVRRIAIATYEVELNMVIHSLGGKLILFVDKDWVTIRSQDVGPGIPDIEMAMREGFSTAPEDVRNLGFGAGMGLPNMRRNADEFNIESALGAGTTIEMRFHL